MKKRFEKFIQHEPNTGCWLWQGCVNQDGYGKFGLNGTWALAHRTAHELYIGPIPSDMHVCHTCDVPSCVNPDHLWLGTDADNARDREQKGRGNQGKGEKHWYSKINDATVLLIRADSRQNKYIASDHGISVSQVCRIKKRGAWVHI